MTVQTPLRRQIAVEYVLEVGKDIAADLFFDHLSGDPSLVQDPDLFWRYSHSRYREHPRQSVLGERLSALAHLRPRAAFPIDECLHEIP